MQEVKQKVFGLTFTNNTSQFKKKHPTLVQGRDLRYKEQWIKILEKLQTSSLEISDISLSDLEQSERMLKNSLLTVGRMSGLTDDQIEADWQRIKLEAQFGDIHIEEL